MCRPSLSHPLSPSLPAGSAPPARRRPPTPPSVPQSPKSLALVACVVQEPCAAQAMPLPPLPPAAAEAGGAAGWAGAWRAPERRGAWRTGACRPSWRRCAGKEGGKRGSSRARDLQPWAFPDCPPKEKATITPNDTLLLPESRICNCRAYIPVQFCVFVACHDRPSGYPGEAPRVHPGAPGQPARQCTTIRHVAGQTPGGVSNSDL